MIAWNTFFKKHDIRLITYTSGPSKTQIDYKMVRNKGRKIVEVIAEKEVAQQHQLLIFDLMICVVKEVENPFAPKRKVGRLNEETTRVEFANDFQGLA